MHSLELKGPKYTLRGIEERPNKPIGMVVMFHGYTGNKNENGYLFKELCLQLSEIGYSSLRFDYMGNGDSDGHFYEMTFDTCLDDARLIINKALEYPESENLVLLGFSMGGAVVSQMMKEYNHLVTKYVMLSPAGNMKLITKERYEQALVYEEDRIDIGGYLVSGAFARSFDKYDLYEGLDKLKVNALVIHGSSDTSVPIEYGQKYAEVLKAKFVEIENSPHCFTAMPFREKVYKNVIAFIQGGKTR